METDLVTKSSKVLPVRFVADVHLVQILGEQLIGSEKVGILELIKNSYDAGATECHVWIERVPGLPEIEPSDPEVAELPGPVITITDNGSGMDEDTIKDGWLRPATRIKTSVKQRLKRERKEADKRGTRAEYESLVQSIKRANNGRLPLGEKGVGRFAAHRLGEHLTLYTKVAEEPHERMLQIDWNDFDPPDDEPKDLGAIEMDLIRREPQHDYAPTNSGTILRIYGGREGFEWGEKKLLEIGHAIANLRSPSRTASELGFNVTFHCPQLSEEIEVPTEIVPAPFECLAIVDEEGKADIEVRFVPPQTLSKPLPPQTWEKSVDLRKPGEDKNYWLDEDKQLRVPTCGPFTAEVKIWYRVKEWIDFADWRSFTEYLENFGGVGVFRDGLSILPAQKASSDDWLKLSTRHIKRGERISYYNMAGSVDLLQENTLDLVDRTSREGLLETRPFNDLSLLVQAIIIELELFFKDIREKYSNLKKGKRIPTSTLNKQARTASTLLNTIADSYDFTADSLDIKSVIGDSEDAGKSVKALSSTITQLRQEVRDLEDQSDALLEAAGYGIAIGVAIHEIEKVTSNIYFGLDRFLKRSLSLKREEYAEVQRISNLSKSLLNELKRIAPLRVTRLERRRKFRVRDSILAARGAFSLSWDDLGIKFIPPKKSDDFEILGSYGACSQVFANLFDNTTYWLRTSDLSERLIMVRMNPDTRRVVVADSGQGIDEKIRDHLFEPFYSLKTPPSGLGLYICKYYMQQMKGTIRESLDSERIPGFSGAHFTLIFPKEEIQK